MRYSVCLFLVCFISTQCLALEKKVSKAKFDELIQLANKLVGFNGSVLVGDSKEVLYYQQVGFADEQHKIPLTEKHLFSTGSIGKEFSTLSIMKLVADNKLKYQDKISKYIDWLPSWSNELTVEHVMTHTSGLPTLNWFAGIETADVDKQIQAVKELAFKPGEGFLYNNMNVVIRGYLVEAITKQPYQEFMANLVLNKVGMSDTIQPIGMKNLSSLITYHEDPNALKTIVSYSTPLDLYKFERALWQDKIIESKAIKEALFGDHLSGSSNRAYFDFGRFYLNDKSEIAYWEHDGSSWPSHHALKYHHFDNDLIITMMSNDGNKNSLFELKTSLITLVENGQLSIPSSWKFKNEYFNKGFSYAYKNLQQHNENTLGISFSESDTNAIGYWLLQQEKYFEAKKVFKINIDRFPNSANAYDSYADALVKLEEYDAARKVLALGLTLAKAEQNQFLITYLEERIKQLAENGSPDLETVEGQ